MEAICDGELSFWHTSVGHTGSMNDMDVAGKSQTMHRILSEEITPRIPYTINDNCAGRSILLGRWHISVIGSFCEESQKRNGSSGGSIFKTARVCPKGC